MGSDFEIKKAKEKDLASIARDLGIKIKSDDKTFEFCPVCGKGKRTPCCFINKKNNTWKCFSGSCGASGSTIDLVKIKKGYELNEAVSWLNNGNGHIQNFVPEQENCNNNALTRRIKAIKNNDKKEASQYLKDQRKINIDAIPKDSYYFNSYKENKWVCFIDNEEKLINLRGINNSDKKNAKGSIVKDALYTGGLKSDIDTIFLVESPINALSSPSYSFLAIFSTSNRFENSGKLANYINGKTVVLAFDPDEAGRKCTEYYRKFIKEGSFRTNALKILNLPENKDINTLCQEDILEEYLNDQDNYTTIEEGEADLTKTTIKPDSEDPESDFIEYGFYKENGCYYTKTFKGKNSTSFQMSNFVMEILYHFIDGTNNSGWLIKIQRKSGEIKTIYILSSDFKKEPFQTILISHNCNFLSTPYLLNLIITYLMDHHTEAYEINRLGYIKEFDFYCFSDCIINRSNQIIRINNLGILEDNNKHFYLPAYSASNFENKKFTNERKFRYKEGDLSFKEWADLLYKAYGVKGSIGICFLINALFRDIVFQELNFFPFLFLFGEAGVGKSSFIDFFLRLFGDKDVGHSIKTSTIKGISRVTSQRINSITFLKEYDSTISRDGIAFLKNGYDGAGYTIAQKSMDNKTDSFFVESAIFIDGNVLPTSESALFDRMIVLTFEKDSFDQEETKAYRKLLIESEIGIGQVVKELLKTRECFKEGYNKIYNEVYFQLKDDNRQFHGIDIHKLPERTIKHITFLLTPIELLHKELQFPFDFSELTKQIIEDAITKTGLLNDLKDVSIFWEAVSWDRRKDFPLLKENNHFIKDFDQKILYIKLSEVIPVYMKYCQENNIQYVDKTTLLSLLCSTKHGFIKSSQKGRKNSYYKKDFGSCYRFSFNTTTDYRIIIINEKEVYI